MLCYFFSILRKNNSHDEENKSHSTWNEFLDIFSMEQDVNDNESINQKEHFQVL